MGVKLIIASRSITHSSGLSICHGAVERTVAWPHGFGTDESAGNDT
ncbi:hypothetical protein ACIOMM_36415 [Streptomyces sp. NPDC087908]